MRNFFLSFLLFTIYYFTFTSPVYSATLTVCPDQKDQCQYTGASGIQKAIDNAKNNDTILIKSGTYKSTNPIVTDPELQYKNCLLHTRGKNITIRGEGNVIIDNANGNLQDDTGQSWSMGVCVIGGEVILEGLTIKQTLRPAIFADETKLIIKNVTFIDIDHLGIELRRSRALIINNLLAGSVGINLSDYSYAGIENNTFYGGGININLCENNQPEAKIENNIIIRGGIKAECKENYNKLAKIKIKNNFVYHGDPSADQNCAKPGNKIGEECAKDEVCPKDGVIFAWPEIEGGDEEGTICVWGEGWIQGSFAPKNNSITKKAGAGFTEGKCANPLSNQCQQYIKNYPFPPVKTLDDLAPPDPNQNQANQQNNSNIISLPFWQNYLKEATSSSQKKSSTAFNLVIYIILSFIYIMILHFAVNLGSEFNLWLTTVFFILGGIIGAWMGSYEFAFVIGVILSLIFISGPKKEM